MPSFSSHDQKNVFVYYKQSSSYIANYHIRDINFHQITHLVYQHADIDEKFNVTVGDEYADISHNYPDSDSNKYQFQGAFGELYKKKQAYPLLQTIISIGGRNKADLYSDIAASATSRTHFALSTLQFIRAYRFNGIEIDWPAPIEGANRPDDPQNLNLLLEEIREVLDIAGQQDKQHYTLMITPSAKQAFQNNWNMNQAQQYLDYFSVPTNYIHGDRGNISTHLAALSTDLSTQGKLIEKKTATGNFDSLLSHYKKQNISPQKIVLNIPTFAIGWNGIENKNNGLYQKVNKVSWGSWDSARTGRTGIYTRAYLRGFLDAPGYQKFWDDTAKVHWLYNASKFDGHFISFEDKDSVSYKIDYIKAHNYNGIALRQIHNDLKGADSLLSQVYAKQHPIKALLYRFNSFYKAFKVQVIITILFLLILVTLLVYWAYKQRTEEQEDADDRAQYIKVRSQLQHIETPLQGIQSLSKQIDNKPLSLAIETEEKLQDINQQSDQLNQLVQQLLSETTLADGSILPKPEPLAPLSIFQNSMRIIFPELKEKNITISLDISQNLKNVHVDKNYLQQFFILLLSYLAQRNPEHTILHIKTIQQRGLTGFEIQEPKSKAVETRHQKQTLQAIKRCANILNTSISYKTTEYHGTFFIGLPVTGDKVQDHNALQLNTEDSPQQTMNVEKASRKNTEDNNARSTQQQERNRLINLQKFSLHAEKLTDIKQLIEAAFELFINDNKQLNITVYEGQNVLHQHTSENNNEMPEVLKLSPSFLGQYRFELRTKEPLQEEDVAYFQSLVAQIQMMRKQISELAKEPQLLSELYEIASQKDHIKYIQADNGYSGIVCDNKDTTYLSLRLKNIKLYFKDESLLQIHRSYLVNPRKVIRVVQLSKIKYEVELEGERLPIARTYLGLLKENFPHWFS